MSMKKSGVAGVLVMSGMMALVGRTGAADAAELKYVGSSTIGKFMTDAKAPFKEKSGFDLAIDTGPESGGGEAAAIAGTADLGGVARDPKPEVVEKGVVCTLIGKDAIAVIVNKDNPVKTLSMAQLKGIFTGQVVNWKEVGGPDQKIVAFAAAQNSATRDVFQKIALGGEEYKGVLTQAPDSTIPEKVAALKMAVGQISLSFISGRRDVTPLAVEGQAADVNNPQYPIARPLNLCTMGAPKGDAKVFIDWALSPEGQTLLKSNFVGIN